MAEIKELLEQFKYYAENPRKQLDKYLAEGKKAVGIFPYYAPEEIVYAGGMVPFGVWGGQGPIEKAKDYFPTFYYSLALRCLEMALDGTLDGLSASMLTTLDDTLRPLSQNYKVSAGKKIPMIFLNHAQHRKEDFGKQYNAKIFNNAKEELEKICNVKITDENLKTWESVKTFGLIGENTKVHKGEALFPRLDIEKEVEELNELFSEKKDEPKEELIEHKENITIDDLDKVELRVGKILSCEKHPKADRLLVSQVKVGPETRQIVSGIAKWYKPEEMVGKDVIVVCNLKPVKLRGVESQGMILAAGNDGDDLIVPVATGANSGCEVR